MFPLILSIREAGPQLRTVLLIMTNVLIYRPLLQSNIGRRVTLAVGLGLTSPRWKRRGRLKI
jgi:hypothetical protein